MQWCNSLLITFQCQTVGLGRWIQHVEGCCIKVSSATNPIGFESIPTKIFEKYYVRNFQKYQHQLEATKTKLPVFLSFSVPSPWKHLCLYIRELGTSRTIWDGNIVFPYCMFFCVYSYNEVIASITTCSTYPEQIMYLHVFTRCDMRSLSTAIC